MKKPFQIGIVGLGKIARDEHIPAILSNPDFELAFVVDRVIRVDLGIPAFRSLDEAIGSGITFDAISICTSPQVRFEICDQLFTTSAAILLEKPAASHYDLAAQINTEAAARDSCVFAAWHSRFAEQVAAAKAWCAEKQNIVSGKIEWRENAEKWHPGQDWIWRKGGFGVFDPGMNALSILTEILPSKWSIDMAHLGIPENAETPSIADFKLKSANTVIHCIFEFHAHDDEIWQISLEAHDGSRLQLSEGGAKLLADGVECAAGAPAGEYENVYRRFSHLITAHQMDIDLQPLFLIEEIFATASRNTEPPVKISI